MKINKFLNCIFGISIFLLLNQNLLNAQDASTTKIQPISEDAYKAILQFYQYDKNVPLDARIIGKRDREKYIREKISFRGIRDSRVPGYLAIPQNGTPPYPCVLQIHSYTLSKSGWWEEDNLISGLLVTEGLLESGFAVFALDLQYHGERIAYNDYESPIRMFRRGWYNRVRDLIVQSTIEYRRAIDYLSTRAEIDTTRIGVIGYSVGGLMTFLLNGIDKRIKASIACCAWTVDVGSYKWGEGYDATGITTYNFIRGIGDRPFLMLMGRSDPVHPVDEAQQIYDLIESDSKDLVFFDCDHELPDEYPTIAVKWFNEHLK